MLATCRRHVGDMSWHVTNVGNSRKWPHFCRHLMVSFAWRHTGDKNDYVSRAIFRAHENRRIFGNYFGEVHTTSSLFTNVAEIVAKYSPIFVHLLPDTYDCQSIWTTIAMTGQNLTRAARSCLSDLVSCCPIGTIVWSYCSPSPCHTSCAQLCARMKIGEYLATISAKCIPQARYVRMSPKLLPNIRQFS